MRRRHTVVMTATVVVLVVMMAFWWRTGITDEPQEPQPFLVTIRNQCHHPVWIFFGPDGELAPQNASSLGGNASMTELMSPGHAVGLLDEDRQRELDRVRVTEDTTSIEVLASCDRLRLNER